MGALIVLAGGVVVGAALVAKDRKQLARAKDSVQRGKAALAKGDARAARREFGTALTAATAVGGLAGQRDGALALADEARAGSLLCDALADAETRPQDGLRQLETATDGLSETAKPRARAARYALLLEAARSLERHGALDLAEKAYRQAAESTEQVSDSDRDAAKKGLLRATARGALARAEAALASGDAATARTKAEEARAALREAAASFDDPAEARELEARAAAIAAESSDAAALAEFEAKVAALAAKARACEDLDAVGRDAGALTAPTLALEHAKKAEMKAALDKAEATRARIAARAAEVLGMVLARAGKPAIFIDRLEVTNAQYLEFIEKGKGYDTPSLWDPAGERRRAVGDFVDATGKPGPRGWANGKPPESKRFHPVVGICAHEARAFARWQGKRLPTRAEWLSAATRGESVDFPFGPPRSRAVANLRIGDGPFDTKPVGECTGQGPTGARDLFGNVKEIVETGLDADGKPSGTVFAIGGSFNTAVEDASARAPLAPHEPSESYDDMGFRCAKEIRWDDE